MAAIFGARLPFAMQAVVLPRWYSEVAPTLPAGRVLLSYPAPFSGLQSAMAWQAVNGMHYSQAGGGGPQGVERRAGTAGAGLQGAVSRSPSAGGHPRPPAPRPSSPRCATPWRSGRSTRSWSPPIPPLPPTQQGQRPLYAAAFMTAALGRLPTIQAGAWVWDDVQLGLHQPLHRRSPDAVHCVGAVEGDAERQVGRHACRWRTCVMGQAGIEHG